jgi:polyisoprenoid-binding protein YceI
MMVTWVRGHFKDVHGKMDFDPDNPTGLALEAEIATSGIWTGEPQRDDHLRSGDFLDVAHFPTMTFQSTSSRRTGAGDYHVAGTLTVRGVARPLVLDLQYLGRWRTPYNEARVTRAGFSGSTRLNRHDFKVDWNSPMESGGVVVGSEVLKSSSRWTSKPFSKASCGPFWKGSRGPEGPIHDSSRSCWSAR